MRAASLRVRITLTNLMRYINVIFPGDWHTQGQSGAHPSI